MHQIMAELALLQNWAPTVLSFGAEASLKDLREIIKLRVRLQGDVQRALEQDLAAPFFAMIRADRLCEPNCRTLLRLPASEALEAAEEAGGHLNPSCWYGVHVWHSTIEMLEEKPSRTTLRLLAKE